MNSISDANSADNLRSVVNLDRATRSLTSTSRDLSSAYFGSRGVVAGLDMANQRAVEQIAINNDLAASLLTIANASTAGGLTGGDPIGLPTTGEQLQSLRTLNSELATSATRLGDISRQARDIPDTMPALSSNFNEVASAVGEVDKAQTRLNRSVRFGMTLQSEEIARAVIASTVKKGSAKEATLAVVKAQTMQAMAGYIASVFTSVPFPFNIALAAGAQTAVGKFVDTALAGASKISIPSFATGGDFVTRGPQLIMVGDNRSGRERVQITPSEKRGSSPAPAVTINITAPLVDESVIDYIAPALVRARLLGKVDVMVGSVDAH